MGIKLFVDCKKANHVCDKSQYNESGFWEKVRLNIHLIYCGACRKYSSRNIKLSKMVNNAKLEPISEDQKNILRARLQEELSK
tara:strand:+ start:76 stop:324 length:249 start_codon:yes stop_codon:yes gene_type:complete